MKSYKKITTNDRELNLIQANIEDAVSGVLKNPLLDGVLVDGINLLSGQPNQIAHTLAREVIGWIVVDQNADARIWKGSPSNSRFIDLRCSNNVSVKVYFF